MLPPLAVVLVVVVVVVVVVPVVVPTSLPALGKLTTFVGGAGPGYAPPSRALCATKPPSLGGVRDKRGRVRVVRVS